MAADEAQQEPTMEEILASIRKIISEDDEPQAETPADEPVEEEDILDLEPEPMPEPVMDLEPEPEPEIEIVEDVVEDDIVAFEPEPEPEPEPPPAPNPIEDIRETSFGSDDKLLEDEVAGSAAGAFGRLMGSVPLGGVSTLEDVVREMLRPMLKDWLNENLPAIVEEKVEEEVKRISRMAK